MRAAGADATTEAADIALMTYELTKISEVIKIGAEAVKIIKQNNIANILFKIIGATIASTGFLSPSRAPISYAITAVILFFNSSQ